MSNEVRSIASLLGLFYFMNFLEKDLEQIIYEADKELLANKGLKISGKLFKQLRIGNYGIADLVSFTRPGLDLNSPYEDFKFRKGKIQVIELKKDNISISAFMQALRYVKGIKTYLEKKSIEDKYNVEILLIGKNLDLESSFIYLTDFLISESDYILDDSKFEVDLNYYTYKYGLNGIEFNQQYGYNLVNKGF